MVLKLNLFQANIGMVTDALLYICKKGKGFQNFVLSGLSQLKNRDLSLISCHGHFFSSLVNDLNGLIAVSWVHVISFKFTYQKKKLGSQLHHLFVANL